jgi:hypothetical protein
MLSTRLRIAAAVLLTLGLGLGPTARFAWADKPGDKPAPAADKPAGDKPAAKPAADKPGAKPAGDKPGAPAADNPDKKGARKDAGPKVFGVVKAVDAAKKTVTVRLASKDGNAGEMTYTLTAATPIVLPTAGKAQAPAGKLSDLSEGINVVLSMAADQKSVASVTVQPPSVHGQVKAVDASKNTISITVFDKRQQQTMEKTYAIAPDAQVMIPGGEKGKQPTAKLTDLAAGQQVNLRLTLDQKTVLGIAVQNEKGPGKKKEQK